MAVRTVSPAALSVNALSWSERRSRGSQRSGNTRHFAPERELSNVAHPLHRKNRTDLAIDIVVTFGTYHKREGRIGPRTNCLGYFDREQAGKLSEASGRMPTELGGTPRHPSGEAAYPDGSRRVAPSAQVLPVGVCRSSSGLSRDNLVPRRVPVAGRARHGGGQAKDDRDHLSPWGRSGPRLLFTSQ